MTLLTKGAAYARALARELPGEPANLLRLAPRLSLEIREVNADGFDGALIRAREVPLGAIVIRKSIREAGRKNFTLAHEIGHFLLPGHDQTELICTKADVGNWGDGSKEIEREADEFAAELLMPGALVQRIIHSATPSMQLIEKIAQRFRTSLSAAAWRYCDLAQEKCAIVWSTGDRIDWSKRSETFVYSLRKGTLLQKDTLAARTFAGLPIPNQPQEVPASSWMSADDLTESAKLWEQSKALRGYGSVISLLWLRP
jgi:Zn-dependent peptidase ImmA (M78 family)